MATKQLRSVKPGETAAPPKKQSVAEAAATGNQLDTLIATRDRVAKAISSDCSPRDLAALTKRLDDIFEKIKTLSIQAAEEDSESTEVDDSFDAAAI